MREVNWGQFHNFQQKLALVSFSWIRTITSQAVLSFEWLSRFTCSFSLVCFGARIKVQRTMVSQQECNMSTSLGLRATVIMQAMQICLYFNVTLGA